MPEIHVLLVRSKFPRKQRWRWVAKSAGNHRTLATSGEAFTNRADAISNAVLLFSINSTVMLRQDDHGDTVLRLGYAS